MWLVSESPFLTRKIGHIPSLKTCKLISKIKYNVPYALIYQLSKLGLCTRHWARHREIQKGIRPDLCHGTIPNPIQCEERPTNK